LHLQNAGNESGRSDGPQRVEIGDGRVVLTTSLLLTVGFAWRGKETGENVENPRIATLKAIKLHDGRNIEASRRIVDDSDIDNKGFPKNE
jgi:hypothetical protein